MLLLCQGKMLVFMPKITQKKMLTQDMLELHLEKPEGLDYQAGQFVQFEIPVEGQIVKRSYSLASTPSDEDLSFCIKILPQQLNGPASAYLPTLSVGDEIAIGPVRGRFCVSEPSDLVLIATGAGIAPIIGIVRDELENRGTPKNVYLLFGLRHEDDVFWKDVFDQLVERYPNFHYTLTLSRPSDTWTGTRGRVTDHVQNHIDNDAKYFLCGSPNMVKDVRSFLVEQKVDPKKIHFEIF